MLEKDIPDGNIFMMCEKVNKQAFKDVPKGFHIRNLKAEELETWMRFPFDTTENEAENLLFMKNFFNDVYGDKKELFFKSCMVVCDQSDKPISTCFVWKAYDKFWTVHWFKTLKQFEGKGLGRAILTYVLKSVPENEFPVYLHTQPSSFRAIKLYSDFGFKILTDKVVGTRKNDYKKSLKYLKYFMGDKFNSLQFVESDKTFSEGIKPFKIIEF